MSQELLAFFLSMVPGTESDAVIPLAVTVWHLSYVRALIFSVLGNAVPFFVVYFGLDVFYRWVERRAPKFVAPLDRVLAHTKKRLGSAYATYGAIALFIYIALPIPLTGVWSASIAASLFRVPKKQAMVGVLGGMLAAAGIVLAMTIFARSV